MRKINLLWLVGLLLTLGLTSCSDDENGGSPNDLVGVWERTECEEWYVDENGQKEELSEDFDQVYIIFNEDGTGVSWSCEIYRGREIWYDDYFAWKVNNGKLYTYDLAYEDYEDTEMMASFNVSGSSLTISAHEKYGIEEYYMRHVYKRSNRTEFGE